MSSTIHVRRATLEDLTLLVDGNLTMARVTENKRLDRETLTQGVKAALEDASKGVYFVAELDGTPAGQLMLTKEWSDWRNGCFWWIQSVFVQEFARRRGVYRALHDHVVQSAREEGGVCGIRLYVERDNRVAANTYAALGMTTCDYNIMELCPLR